MGLSVNFPRKPAWLFQNRFKTFEQLSLFALHSMPV